jgi:hypothetical protein
MFLLQDDRVRIEDSSSLIFIFLRDFPNVRVYLIFLPFQGQNHDSLLFINSMILFFSQSCWTTLRIFPATNQKYMQCFDVRWHACILTWIEIYVPPHRCSIITGCLCLLFKAFFILSMYWFIRVLAFHSDVSAVSIVGCPWRLLLSLLLKLDHASKCGVARFIMKELNKSSIS